MQSDIANTNKTKEIINNMEDQKTQLLTALKQAKNVLVTVSKSPSVDQLSAAIGLTLALNKLDKHASAVYSGTTPSTLDFLRPEDTLEKTTDSLRDFIIALDKTKADKLRYKVEDQMVRIFITPYHTAISADDLDFSQGDFNVDVVLALGVESQQDIDDAVVAHGRILHDATVASLSLTTPNELGTINWVYPEASSFSEMAFELLQQLDTQVLDGQIATSLLTGIVAATERFSNDRTTPQTMSASAALMAAGANQQLITTELEGMSDEHTSEQEALSSDPGMLEIEHAKDVVVETPVELVGPVETTDIVADAAPKPQEPQDSGQPQIQVDDEGYLHNVTDDYEDQTITESPIESSTQREHLSGQPLFGDGQLSANTEQETTAFVS